MPQVGLAGRNMDLSTFNRIRRIVYERSGISIRDGKEAMVRARIAKRMRVLGIETPRAYVNYLTEDATGEESVHLLDVISTNVTSFFRQPDQFDFLRKAVAGWVDAKQTRFRFWSAACSTGEEPYSLAIALLEALAGRYADVKILATDISTRVLERCRAGTYADEEFKEVDPLVRDRYFDRQSGPRGVLWTVGPELRRCIVFKRMNLSQTPFPLKGPLDAILCRNVMIYFDHDGCRRLLNEMYRLLKPGGYLMTGHAESLTALLSSFKAVRPSIYTRA